MLPSVALESWARSPEVTVPFQPPIQHATNMSTLLPNQLWVPALFTPSTVGSSHPQLSDTCATPAPTRLWAPPFYLFIYLFIYYHHYYYYLLSRSFPSHCGGSFPSQWSSSPSHCGLLPFSLSHWGSSLPQHGPLSHHTQVRGSSPYSRGGVLSLLLRGLSSISAVRLSLFLSRGSPSLLGAHPHLIHSTVGLPHISVGLPHIAVELFTISTWGFFSLWGLFPISLTQLRGFPTSLWGSSPSQLWGLPTSLWDSSPSFRGASSRCGALPHLAR